LFTGLTYNPKKILIRAQDSNQNVAFNLYLYKPSVSHDRRLTYFTYTKFDIRFQEIYQIFSNQTYQKCTKRYKYYLKSTKSKIRPDPTSKNSLNTLPDWNFDLLRVSFGKYF